MNMEEGWTPSKNASLCELHFEQVCFRRLLDGTRCTSHALLENACPTIFNNPPKEKRICEKPKKCKRNQMTRRSKKFRPIVKMTFDLTKERCDFLSPCFVLLHELDIIRSSSNSRHHGYFCSLHIPPVPLLPEYPSLSRQEKMQALSLTNKKKTLIPKRTYCDKISVQHDHPYPMAPASVVLAKQEALIEKLESKQKILENKNKRFFRLKRSNQSMALKIKRLRTELEQLRVKNIVPKEKAPVIPSTKNQPMWLLKVSKPPRKFSRKCQTRFRDVYSGGEGLQPSDDEMELFKDPTIKRRENHEQKIPTQSLQLLTTSLNKKKGIQETKKDKENMESRQDSSNQYVQHNEDLNVPAQDKNILVENSKSGFKISSVEGNSLCASSIPNESQNKAMVDNLVPMQSNADVMMDVDFKFEDSLEKIFT